MGIRRACLFLAAGAVATGLAGQGIVIQQKPAFASTDSFQTKGFVVHWKFKTADGSVHPAGRYSFKVRGTGKAGEALIIIIGSKTGKPVGKVMGVFQKALGGPDTKTSQRNPRSQTSSFDKLGFSSASPVKVAPQGNDFIIVIDGGKQGSIQAALPGAS
jgi:hypothetical protein